MQKHHVWPRHLGGTDNTPSDNVVMVEVEEHAKIHHSQWILGGRWQDEVAWKVLSGQIGKEEAQILAVKYANTGRPSWNKGKKHSEEHKRNLSINHQSKKEGWVSCRLGKPGAWLGRNHSEESKQKMRGPKCAGHAENVSKGKKGISNRRPKGLKYKQRSKQ